MAMKVLIVLLASHCVPAAEIASLMAPNYAKVFRTGSITSTKTDTENGDKEHDHRQVPHSVLTTEASDFYNVYYPVMEAQTVTDSNDTQTVLQPPSAVNPLIGSGSSVNVLRLNPLASFINAFFRQPMYATKNSEEKTESSLVEQSASDDPSSQPDTTKLPSALNQPVYSYEPSSYDAGSQRLYSSGQTEEYPNEEYVDPKEEKQNVYYVNSQQYPLPVNKIFPPLKDFYQSTSEDPYELKDSFQSSRSENFYELGQSYQPVTAADFHELGEYYNHSIVEISQTPREPHQHTTIENPYKLFKERYQIFPSEDEDDKQGGSKLNDPYSYDSFKSKIPPNEGSGPYIQKAASSSHKHQHATGREKNPYTYFYVGRKLWYVPLFFSVYFMFYVLALVVKSISRHKIVFPVTQWSKNKKRDLNAGQERLGNITHQITTALETTERLYM
ncbi:hypothetical protein L798_04350 [Zootermopsis nevadensis]|uniref:Uncharacterized protein n=2 Tax=Zootermopsis nevadensis TaxID=136037 RepID=A0A067RKN9_ZOONE|nr:hypothetical protein L798_04350 [Zootermopsis nevadensis]